MSEMDSDLGIARELGDLQKLRAQYQPELPPCLQGTTVRVEFGDATTAADPLGAHTISRSSPQSSHLRSAFSSLSQGYCQGPCCSDHF